jgi:hypothetical protein
LSPVVDYITAHLWVRSLLGPGNPKRVNATR